MAPRKTRENQPGESGEVWRKPKDRLRTALDTGSACFQSCLLLSFLPFPCLRNPNRSSWCDVQF